MGKRDCLSVVSPPHLHRYVINSGAHGEAYDKHTGASAAPIARSGAVGVPPTAVGRRRERFPHLRMGHSCMLQLNSNTQYIPLSVAIEMAQAGTKVHALPSPPPPPPRLYSSTGVVQA